MTDASGRSPALDEQQRRVLSALLSMQRHSWEQGVASHALLDLGAHDLARAVAVDAVTRQTEDGRLGELDRNIVNSGALGEVVLWAVREAAGAKAVAQEERRNHDNVNQDNDPAAGLRRAADRQLAWLCRHAARADDGTLFHMEGLREIWADTVYMVVPMLVAAGCTDEASRQLDGHRRRLFDPSTGLYGWRWNERERRASHPEHWGTASGWVVAAIARALHPSVAGRADDGIEHEPFAEQWAAHARTIIDACLATADASGLFHNVLDDHDTFVERNAAQMLAYAMLTGVTDGWLPKPYADRARALVYEARDHVDELGLVREVCGSPHFDRQGTSAEAQAFFLLATNAEHRLDGSMRRDAYQFGHEC